MNTKWIACALMGALVVAGDAQTPAPERMTMQEAVAFAQQHSPILRGALAEVAAARGEVGVARSKVWPQLALHGFASRGNMSGILSSSMGVEPSALVMTPDKGYLDGNVSLMLPLYTGGSLTSSIAAASSREQAALAEAAGMRAEVALRVREAYARALYGAELAAAQASRVKAAEGMVANARARLESGMTIEASVRRAEAELAEAQQDLTMFANERKKTVLDLLEEMGASMEKEVQLADGLAFAPPSWSLQESLAMAEKYRGELIAARHRISAAHGQVATAEGSLRPQVYGFAMGDAFAPKDAMGRRTGYTIGLSVSVPVFDGGMRRSEAAAARGMREKAKADADAWKLQVEKEVRQAWVDIDTAAQNYKTAQSAAIAAQSAYEVMVLRIDTGKSILVEQLDALAALTRARANVARALYEHHLAVARLSRAIGVVDLDSTGGKR